MDFHYDGVDYSIPGNTQILLTDLIETMQITVPDGDEDPDNDPLLDVNDVESVVFSDEHLVEVTQVSGLITIYGQDGKLTDVDAGEYNFLLSSLAPFSTEEKLTITLKDGTVIEVGVTDAQTILTVSFVDENGNSINQGLVDQSNNPIDGKYYYLMAETLSDNGTPYFRIYRMKNFDSIAIQDSDKYNCEASWDEVYLNASSDIKSLKIVYAGSDQYGYKAGGPFYDATNVGDYTVKELPASITGNTATIKMQGPAAYPVTLNFYDALAVREGEAPNYTVSGDPKEFAAQGQNEKFYVRVYCNDTDGKRIGYALVEVDIEGKTTLQVPVSKFKAIDENGNDLYTTFLYNPAEHVITANDTRFITDKNNTYNLSNNPNYQIVSNSNLDYATPEGWEAFANINNADGGNTISVRKAKEKEYVVRINIDPPTATQGSTESINITDSDDIYLLVKAVHTTGGTGYYLQKLVLSSNDPVEIHVDKWYYDNGNERVGEVYTGGEIDVTPYIVKPKVGKTISSIGNALDTMNTADEISVGQEIKVYGYTSLDNSDKTNIESDPNDPTREFHIDTITLSAPQGTIKRSDIMNAVANARHFGFYTLDWLGHEADMESNGAAWHVSFTNVGSDWGFSGNNLRNNKIFVSKEYVDAEGNPVANRTIKLKLVMIKKEAMSDGGIGGDSTTEWIQEVTTDSNGRVTTTFPGLYSGTYRVYEEINGTWVAWNSSVKVFGEGASKVTVTFLDEDGNVIELGDNPTEHDIVLSNTNYYVYFGDLSNVPDETIKDLITKARSGSGKKFVVQASDYDRVSALNNALSVSNRATILVAGQHGAPNYNMPADFESYIALSRRLATEQSSSTVRVLNIKASEIGDAIDLIDDGRFLVINVDTQGADVVKTKLRLHGDQYPDGAVTVTAHFNQDGYNWSSRILWNILDGTEPTTRTVNTGENSSGIFLIPAGQTSTLGGNWGGTIIAGKYYHTGAEIHSEQWDDDIDMGKAAMRNLLGNGTSAELSAEKKFENWGDEDKFTFVLEQEDTAPMPVDSVNDDGVKYSEASSEDKAVGGFTKTVVLTKPLHGDEATALFGSMVYASSGTYKYRIKEVIPAAEDRGDITYDETVYTVTVHVTADDSGDLSVSYSMTANPAKTPSVDYTEQTTYTAPVLINAREEAGVGSLKLKKTLTINGAAATEDTVQYLSEDSYTFTFTITGADNNTVTGFTYYDDNGDLVTAEQNSITLTLNKSGDTWTVADLSKELKLSNLPAGTYILTETAPSAPVSLTGRAQIDVNGTAVSTGDAVPEDTNSIKVEVVAGEDTNVQTAAFTNDAGKGKLSIKKTVTGDVNVGPFTFTVKNTDTNKYYTVTGNANTVNLVAEGSANDTAQTVSVGKGYTLTITDLPFGHYEVVETGKYEYEGYIWTKTMTPENGQVTVTDATDATPVEVTVDNAYVKEGKGMLKLYKSFSFDGMPIDLNNLTEAQKTALRNLTFTVKKGDQYVTWDNATAGEGNIHGRWAKLDDRESSFNYFDDFRDGMLVLENLPTGTYTITENGTDAFVGYTWTLGTVQVNRDGTLVEHENPTSVEVTNVQVNPLDAVNGDFTQVFFANTYKQNVGQLSVIKALDVKDEAGVAVAAPGTEFTDKTYRVAVYAKDDEENRTYYATNGKALNKTENQWVEIKSGEDKKVTWTNLPIGTYYVEEFYDEADVDGYTRTTTITVGETETDIVEVGDNPVTAAAVDVPIYDEDDTTTVKLATVTNAYTRDKGTLKVNKKVFVNNTDATSNNTDKVFYMKVQYVDAQGTTWYMTADGTLSKVLADQAIIEIKPGTVKEFKDIPTGEYTITEVNADGTPISESVTATAIGNNTFSFDMSKTKAAAEVTKGFTATANLVNKYTNGKYCIAVTKQWLVNGEVYADDSLTLTVKLQRTTTPDDANSWTDVKVKLNGATEVDNITLTKTNNWSAVAVGMDQMDAAGNRYSYRWVEGTVSGGTFTAGAPAGWLEGESEAVQSTTKDGTTLVFLTKLTNNQPTTEVPFEAEKNLTGRTLEDGEFTFAVLDQNDNEILTGTNDEDGKVDFGSVTYTLADLEKAEDGSYTPKTFTYTVKETSTDANGVTVDTTVYTVNVTVSLNVTTGKLEKTITITKPGVDDVESITFANGYTASGETTIKGIKTLENRVLEDGDKWTFKISGVDDAPMKKANGSAYSAEELSVQNSGSAVTFPTFYYTLDDLDTDENDLPKETTFTYTVTESGDVAGVTNDATTNKTVTVTVSDNGDGKLNVVKSGDENKAFEFINVQKLAKLNVKKVVAEDGKTTGISSALEGKVFLVAVSDSNGNYYALNGEVTGKTVHWVEIKNGEEREWLNLPFGTYTVKENEDVADVTGYDRVTTIKVGDEEKATVDLTKEHAEAAAEVEVENAYTRKTTKVQVKKVWKDADGRETTENLPESLSVNLLANGERVQGDAYTKTVTDGVPMSAGVVTLTADNSWESSIYEVPAYKDGEKITYTWSESSLPEGWSLVSSAEGDLTEVDGENATIVGQLTTITNQYKPDVTSVSVLKVWDDGDNRDGSRPDSIQVQLQVRPETTEEPKPAGKEVETVTLPDSKGNWSYIWTDLPVKADGETLSYEVVEVGATENKLTVTKGEGKDAKTYVYTVNAVKDANNWTITNSYAPETVDVPVVKLWDDFDDKEKERPGSVTVILWETAESGEKKPIAYFQLTKDNAEVDGQPYSHIFEDLPKYRLKDTETGEEIEEIKYSVSEIVEGYVLYDKYVQVGAPVFNKNDYNLDGVNSDGVWEITNKYEPKTEVTVQKVWDDNNDQDGKRPESIVVNLYKKGSGEPVKEKEVTLNAANNWTHTWTDLDKYFEVTENGVKTGGEYEYTVEEAPIEAPYTVRITGDAASGFTITNTHIPETTEIYAKKVWKDHDDFAGEREDVTLRLIGTYTDNNGSTVSLKIDDSDWVINANADENRLIASWKKLPKYVNGKEITYAVVELNVVDGKIVLSDVAYTVTTKEGEIVVDGETVTGTIITNSYEPKTKAEITKIWDDESDNDGMRPTAAEYAAMVHLYKGEGDSKSEVQNVTPTVIDNGDNTFTVTWSELPVFEDANADTPIVYTVEEDEIEGYVADKTSVAIEAGKSGTLTNTHTPIKTLTQVVKVWEDSNNQDGKRPETVTMKLYANNVDTGITVTLSDTVDKQTRTANTEGVYKYATFDLTTALTATVKDLPAYVGGVEQTYTWVEDQSNLAKVGYTIKSIVVGNDDVEADGYKAGDSVTITNTYTPDRFCLGVLKVWDDQGNKYELRPTDVTVALYKKVGTEYKPVNDITGVLNAANNWSFLATGLPIKENGADIQYYWKEVSVPAGYTLANTDANGYIPAKMVDTRMAAITNKLDTGDLKITKKFTGELPINSDLDHLQFSVVGKQGEKTVYNETFYYIQFTKTGQTGILELKDLPVGNYTVTEITTGVVIDNYTLKASTVKVGTAEATQNLGTGTLAKGQTLTFEFENEYEQDKGNLSITKVLQGAIGNEAAEKTFTFIVKLSDTTLNAEYKYKLGDEEQTDTVKFVNGECEIVLHGGETETILDLPAGLTYSVTETETEPFELTAWSNETGIITKDTTVTATFTNTRKKGELTVTKTVVSDLSTDLTAATFTVEIELKNGTDAVSDTFDAKKNGNAIDDVTFTDGVATLNDVQNGDTYTITDLPVGLTYTVKETGADGFTVTYNGETSENGETGTIEAKTNVAIVNTRIEGNLEIHKTVVSPLAADETKRFTFTITMKDKEGTAVNGVAFTGELKRGTSLVGERKISFTSGTATIDLAHDETMTIKGIPAEWTYSVEETTDTNFTTVTSGDVTNVIVLADTTKTGTFTNSRVVAPLTIDKTVVSPVAADQSMVFNYTLLFNENLNGEYAATVTGTVTGVEDATEGTAKVLKIENGKASFTLTGGSSLTVNGLPIGVTYTVIEQANPDFVADALQKTGTIAAPGVEEHYTNTRKVGELAVSKTVVSANAADKTKEFNFTITFTNGGAAVNLKGEIPYTVKHAEGEDTEGKFTMDGTTNVISGIKLKDGDVMTITNLPLGAHYVVAETAEDGFVTTTTGETGDVKATAVTAAFTNTKQEGGLIVSKSVVSDVEADRTRDYSFKVELSDESISGTYGEMTFTNGVATFTLKDGETKSATGLPKGIGYTVTETDSGNMIVQKTGDTGTIDDVTVRLAEFTNTRETGELEISKTVVSDMAADHQVDFKFTITLKSGTQNLNGAYDAKWYLDGTQFASGKLNFVNGEAVVYLHDGEKIALSGIPVNATWTVEEAANADFNTTADHDEGVINKDQSSSANFTNTRKTGELTIEKSVVSPLAADEEAEYSFKILLDADITGEYEVTGQTDKIKFTDGVATLTIKGSGSKTIKDLPAGIHYTIIETAVDGMTTAWKIGTTEGSGDTAKGIVEESGKVTFTNTRDKANLEIEKTVFVDGVKATDNPAVNEKTFYVKVKGVIGGETYWVTSDAGLVSKTEAEAKIFEVKPNVKLTISGLPVGEYTVTELNDDDHLVAIGDMTYLADLSRTEDSATLAKDVDGAASLVNAYTTSKFTVAVTKQWLVNGEAYVNDDLTLDVKLQSRLATATEWTDVTKVYMGQAVEGGNNAGEAGNDTINLNKTNNWSAVAVDLPDMNDAGVRYEYRWVELNDTEIANVGETIVADGQKWTVGEPQLIQKDEDPAKVVYLTKLVNSQVAVFVPVKKLIEGNDYDGDGKFTFTIANGSKPDGATAPISDPETIEIAKDETGKFNVSGLGMAGTYTFTVTEQQGDFAGMDYDTDAKTVTVEVEADANKVLTVKSVSVTEDKPLEVTNTYHRTTAQPEVIKDVDDSESLAPYAGNEEFIFTLAAVDGAPMPAAGGELKTAKDGEKAVFGEIEYTAAGTYYYTITETEGTTPYMTYDTEPHMVKVVVSTDETDESGKALKAVVTYEDDDKTELTVTNTYIETTTAKVHKVWADNEDQDGIRPTSITVKLMSNKEGETETTEVKTVTLDAKSEWSATVEGLDVYKDGKKLVYTWDEEVPAGYTVTSKVENLKEDGVVIGEVTTLTNTHTPGTTSLTVTKAWKNADGTTEWPASIEKITVQLTEKVGEGDPVPVEGKTLVLTKDKITDTFADLTEKRNGKTIIYGVKELDVEGYTAVVGELDENKITITNHEYPNTTIKATKVLTGREWTDEDSFEFKLKANAENPDGAKLPETLTKTADKENKIVEFGPITFTQAGTYKYTVTETVPKDAKDNKKDGVLYDGEAKEVTIVVRADSKGVLTIDNSASTVAVEITNVYSATGSAILTAQKTLEGSETIEADRFTFALLDKDQKTLQTKGNAADGSVTFDAITYTLDDLKNSPIVYTIKEVIPAVNDGIVYDTHEETVTVTLVDNGDGTITATPDKTGLEVKFENKPTEVKVSKKDVTGEAELPGASFQILDAENAVVDSWTSTTEPHVKQGLKVGTYTLRETAAPKGYTKAADATFTIAADGTVTSSILVDGVLVVRDTKATEPTFEKKAQDVDESTGVTSDWQDSADYDIDAPIPFKLTATLANNVTDYKNYHITFHDVMENGLTFVQIDMVKVGDKVVSNYTLSQPDDQHFSVTLNWQVADGQITDTSLNGQTVEVYYTAKLNGNAVVGKTGNLNTGRLEYSNNPNVDDDGNPSDDTDVTPEDAVIVFTYQLDVNKVNENGKALNGADFKLEKLLNGSKSVVRTYTAVAAGSKFSFKGLDQGVYVLTETKVPDGYKAIDPITFEVKADYSIVWNFPTEDRGTVLKSVNGSEPTEDKVLNLETDPQMAILSGEVENTPAEKPELKKEVKDTNDTTGETSAYQDSADYDIGDEVPFRLTATLADNVTDYLRYFVTFSDTMENGLTFTDITKVTVNGEERTDFVKKLEKDEHGFKLTLTWGTGLAKIADESLNKAVVVVDFTAKLNDNAKTGSYGNANKAKLIYSCNPNTDQDGKPSDDTDETDEDAVIVFTYQVDINKVDEKGDTLKGAQFKLEKKLADGTLEEIDRLTIDEETKFSFTGLDDGIYVLTETKAPDWYQPIEPITFTVTATHIAWNGTEGTRGSVLTGLTGDTASGELVLTPNLGEGILSGDVKNTPKDKSYPETGGSGTAVYYVAGAILLLVAAGLLIGKRRMGKKN